MTVFVFSVDFIVFCIVFFVF